MNSVSKTICDGEMEGQTERVREIERKKVGGSVVCDRRVYHNCASLYCNYSKHWPIINVFVLLCTCCVDADTALSLYINTKNTV